MHLCILLFYALICIVNKMFNLELKKFVHMGRGDKKTRKGKIFKGSFGKSRPSKQVAANKTAAKTAAKK